MWAGADQNAIEIQNRKASHLAVAKSVKMTATQEERALVDLFGPNTRKDFKEHFRLTPVHESIIRLRHDPNIDTPDLSELLDLVSQANRAPENQDWSRWKATLSNHASPLWEVLDLFHKSAVKLQASGPQNRRPSYDLMNQPDFNGWTPLHWAAYSGRLKETRILLEKGACANQLTSSNRNLLHHVAESGNDELMGAVLQHDCRPTMYLDQQDLWGETPLHIAATRSLGCVRLLLDHGANTRLLQSERQTPLHWASQAGETQRLAITDLLSIRDPSLVNVKDEAGRTPIFLFLAMPDCVRLLLARGAITDIRDHLKRNLLHDACAGNHYEALKALLPRCHTQSIHQKDSRGIKPLEEAFERSSVDCIIILLERKDIHFDLKMGKKGWNLLHYAVHLGDAQVVELVLDGRFKLSDLISNTPQGQSVEQLAGSNLKHESRDEVLNLLNRLKK
jgi:ankyrin repeat protein